MTVLSRPLPYTLELHRSTRDGSDPLYDPARPGSSFLRGTVASAVLPRCVDLCGYVPLADLLPFARSLGYRVRLSGFTVRRDGVLRGVSFYGDEPLTPAQERKARRLLAKKGKA